jgi:hypothetical protein
MHGVFKIEQVLISRPFSGIEALILINIRWGPFDFVCLEASALMRLFNRRFGVNTSVNGSFSWDKIYQ